MKYSLRSRLQRIDYKKLFYRVLAIAAVLLVVSGYLSYTRLYLTPERRFWMAMNNNMSVPSVTRTVETGGTGNKQIETTRFTFGGQTVQDKISSVGFKNATSESKVVTRTLTTPETQYVKYVDIFSTETKADGSSYNFKPVLGLWARDDTQTDNDSKENKRLTYAQPYITLAPFGNLSADARNRILAEMKASGAYEVDFGHETYRKTDDGRKYMVLGVHVHTKKYVSVLQHFFTAAGYGNFPPLNPENYPENARVNAEFVVDMRSNTLTSISYNSQTEQYSHYGVTKQVTLPKETVSLEKLQSTLQAAQ